MPGVLAAYTGLWPTVRCSEGYNVRTNKNSLIAGAELVRVDEAPDAVAQHRDFVVLDGGDEGAQRGLEGGAVSTAWLRVLLRHALRHAVHLTRTMRRLLAITAYLHSNCRTDTSLLLGVVDKERQGGHGRERLTLWNAARLVSCTPIPTLSP